MAETKSSGLAAWLEGPRKYLKMLRALRRGGSIIEGNPNFGTTNLANASKVEFARLPND
jgi:hypothetical protein